MNHVNCDNNKLKTGNKDSLAFKNGQTSFITLGETVQTVSQLEMNTSTQEMLKLETKLVDMFKAQMYGRAKRRYTRDGKLCASAFVQNKKTYYDCTQDRSPDGKNDKLEWCYIDIHARRGKDWAFCKPIIDYDKVREKHQTELHVVTTEARRVTSELDPIRQVAQDSIRELELVRNGHAEMDNRINLMHKSIESMHQSLQYLFAVQKKWEREEMNALQVATKLEEIRAAQEAKAKKKKKKEFYPTDPITLKNEMTIVNSIINPNLQRKEKSDEKNCDGLEGYEEEGKGNGITGEYFDNEDWIGNGVVRIDSDINFNWISMPPVPGVNPNNFSVKWEGYIKAQYTGDFRFLIDTNDHAMLSINDKLVISHNMHTALTESTKRGNVWLNAEVHKTETPNKNHEIAESKSISMIGGVKYKIVLSYYHSIHTLQHDEYTAGIRFSWSGADFTEVVVPGRNLYVKNRFPPLKVTEANLEDVAFTTFDQHDLVFKDSERYVLDDIPSYLSGGLRFKFPTRYKKDYVKFKINAPINIWFGILSQYPNPIPESFENMGYQCAILEINPKKLKPGMKKIFAIKSGVFKLYKKRFTPGRVRIPLRKIGANKKGIPMMLFFTADTSGAEPISCGGKETEISAPKSKYFKNCSASSLTKGVKCSDAVRGKLSDDFGNMWYSNGEGIGAWYKVSFKGVFMVTKFKYKPRSNSNERNKKIQLLFSDGGVEEFIVPNNDDLQEFHVKHHQTQFIVVKIKEVYGTINNGGAFQFFGIECKNLSKKPKSKEASGLLKAAGKDPKTIPPLFEIKSKKIISLNCRESVSNSKQFIGVPTSLGASIEVECHESCATEPYVVYGNNKYTKDSPICKSAFHNQKIQSNGGLIIIKFSEGLSTYEGAEVNGVKSYPKSASEITLQFEPSKKEDEIILKESTKVDIKNPKGTGYLAATITDIMDKKRSTKIKVAVEGSTKKIEYTYPDPNVIPCGDKVKGRDCKGSRKTSNVFKTVEIKFAPKSWRGKGSFLKDNGGIYGSTGHPFGWSKDISNRFKEYKGRSKKHPEIENMVHFPPSPLSRYCKKEIPDAVCSAVDWSVKAGDGRFVVKILIGDPTSNSKIDLSLNGEPIFNKTLPKGQMKILEHTIDSVDGFISIGSKCENDCDYSMTKMSSIKIVPFSINTDSPPPIPPQKKLKCGGSITGGKCDKGNDVVHCLFEDPSNDRAKECTGENMMMEIPKESECKNQIGLFKCVKRNYTDKQQCTIYCPKKCKGKTCA